MNEELDILEILKMFAKKWWIILICVVVVGCIAYGYTKTAIDPTYCSSASLYINSQPLADQNDGVNVNAVLQSQRLVQTYIEILKTRAFLSVVADDVADGTKYVYTASSLKSIIQLSSVEDTFFFNVRVLSKDPHDAYLIADSVVRNAPEAIANIVEGGIVRVCDNADENSGKVAPNVTKNTMVGLAIGAILGALIIFCLEMLDTRIKTTEAFTKKVDIPVLAEIPSMLGRS